VKVKTIACISHEVGTFAVVLSESFVIMTRDKDRAYQFPLWYHLGTNLFCRKSYHRSISTWKGTKKIESGFQQFLPLVVDRNRLLNLRERPKRPLNWSSSSCAFEPVVITLYPTVT
jgi:hypothetical protein